MAAVDRTRAEQEERPGTVDAGVAAAVRLDRRADRVEVAAPAAARPIRSGVRVASPEPVRVIRAVVPVSRVLRLTAEPARLDRAARPAAAVAAAPLAPVAVAAAAVVGPVGPADPRCAARARARAASFACDLAVVARLHAAIRSPMVANVRRDGPIGLSATLHQHRGQAARSRRALLPLLSASRGPRRAAPRSLARASRRTSARAAEDAASSVTEK